MKRDSVLEAYDYWCSTGNLVSDKTLVVAMLHRFQLISQLTDGIPDYALVTKHARQEADRLENICGAREYL